jgi:uncharacterized protein YkwD
VRLLMSCLILASAAAAQVTPAAIIGELNYARQKPQAYAKLIQEWIPHFDGKLLELPRQTPVMTYEGASAVLEAVRALRAHKSMGAVTELATFDRAAADLVRDQGPRGGEGHTGSDGSQPWTRMQRYAKNLTEYGEAIAYGPGDARSIIIGLLVDDGVADRGHRQILLNPVFHYAGVSCGKHAAYHQMCVVDLAR